MAPTTEPTSERVAFIRALATETPWPSVAEIIERGGREIFPESFWHEPVNQARLQTQIDRRVTDIWWPEMLLVALFCPEEQSTTQALSGTKMRAQITKAATK